MSEGKNLADLHQTYSRHDVRMSETARSGFVSVLGLCIFVTGIGNKIIAPKLGGYTFTSLCSAIKITEFSWYGHKREETRGDERRRAPVGERRREEKKKERTFDSSSAHSVECAGGQQS